MNTAYWQSLLAVRLLVLTLLLPAFLSAREPPKPSQQGPKPKRFEWSSYLQLRYTGIEDREDLYALRRFRLIFRGFLKPHLEYYIQGNFKAGNRSSTDGRPYLQDAWIKYTGWKYGHLTLGQFKPPFGMENLTSPWRLISLDRSEATNHLVPNGRLGDSFSRARGLRLDAWLAAKRFYYAAGIFDGNGANSSFRGNGPLLAGRVVGVIYRPPSRGLRQNRIAVGAAVSTRSDHRQDFTAALPGTAALGYDRFSGRDTRLNLEASADFSPLSIRSEYFYATFNPNLAPFVAVRASGFYVQGALRFQRNLQALAKYEGFNPNRAVRDRNDLRWTTLGLNWYIRDSRARLSADYVFKHEARDSFPNNALLLQFQFFLH